MRISVTSETTISFEIEVDGDDGKAEGILRLDGGTWVLDRTPQKGTTWLASGRIEWPEAVKRALQALAADCRAAT